MKYACALRAAALPAVQQQGAVTYLSGGVDIETAAAIQSEARRWPMMLEFAVKDKPVNDYLADVAVVVRDRRGVAVLETKSDGPFLLAHVEPGRYKIEATFAGKTLQGVVHVKAGEPSKGIFMWPTEYVSRGG